MAAKPVHAAAAPSNGDASAFDVADPPTGDHGKPQRKLTWDEDGIQAHNAERGVLFGLPPPLHWTYLPASVWYDEL